MIQLLRMNCDGLQGAGHFAGWPPTSYGACKLSADPGRTVLTLTFKQDTAVKLPPYLKLEYTERAS